MNEIEVKGYKALFDLFAKGLIFITGMVYFLGYIKYFMILTILNVKVSVGDIFTPFSIFISGLAGLITIIVFPSLLFFIKCIADYLSRKFFPYTKKLSDLINDIINKLKSKIENPILSKVFFVSHRLFRIIFKIPEIFYVVYVFLVGGVVYLLSSISFDFILIPKSGNHTITMLFLFYIILFYSMSVSMNDIKRKQNIRKKMQRGMYIIAIISWGIITMIMFYDNFSNSFNNNIQYSTFNQDSGMQSSIYTKSEIPVYSEPYEKNYLTKGILLSINKGNYFFYCIKDDDYKKGRLVMIPVNDVILTEYYEDTIFGGGVSLGGGATK